MRKLSVKDLDLKGKRVLMRVDFNVPLKEKRVIDDTRIKAALPTINFVLDKGASLVLMSHLGRPKGKVVEDLRMDPVAKRLEELLGRKVKKLDECVGETVKREVEKMRPGDIILLENTRFYKEEKANEENFAKKLASFGDIFVNDAFGTAHRAHASTVGVTKFLPAAAGLLMEKELKILNRILTQPDSPFIALLGGAKVSDKIGVIANLLDKCESILIGGGMAYTFLKAKKIPVGNSLIEEERIEETKNIMERALEKGCSIYLPVDHIIASEVKEDVETKIVGEDEIPPGFRALDIGPETIKLFGETIRKARTIFWNGPMGVFEIRDFAKGTEEIAKILASSGATTIVGGGDTIAALERVGLKDKMSYISTGGGASLKFLEGEKLPGVEALSEKRE
ncbi:phosphoglycerate kinase [Candidatus Aerophobetes bacterium]|nr:phosphoglycerate kinase [Candidatus Aerophobetes bacterium]